MNSITKKGVNCKVFCCVPGCNSKGTRDRTLSFHLFPTKRQKVEFQTKLGKQYVDRRLAWILRTKIGKKVSPYMKVCSKHFLESDFFYSGNNKVQRVLLKTAVPSQNLPKRKFEQTSSKRQPPKLRKRELKNPQICGNENENPCEGNSLDFTNDELICPTTEEIDCANTLLVLAEGKALVQRDVAVQVRSGDLCGNFCLLLNNDKKLNTLTGLPSIALLNTICELIVTYGKVKQSKLGIKERVILTFMKMKTNVSYRVLSILFDCVVPNTCRNIFFDTLTLLYSVLRPAVPWLPSETVFKNMPKCFQHFPNVRLILDCTEIFIERPKCLCCRIKVYSVYKSTTTVKFLLGVSPAGVITFVSDAYGGRASDKVIFEQSNLILKLKQPDEIMVDKGFLIDNVCEQHNIKIVRPPFLKNKKQLSKEEALLNVEIARARVHIERVNQRIKIFKMLSSRLPANLVPKIQEIFFIACAITNLSAPVLASDKF